MNTKRKADDDSEAMPQKKKPYQSEFVGNTEEINSILKKKKKSLEKKKKKKSKVNLHLCRYSALLQLFYIALLSALQPHLSPTNEKW
ncbi:hypothetical protein BCV72DRAFT_313632 [Rhizopus microsporus var. microsporus]|uniref:Uncharacterized protein n=1 Tax=Rhizopus microsporus var. microsporus TaxID=86635 RepID=A0A1X0QWH7_RHIZD|nr:hypothetical protein BCV72DRAFT_313632 [Rhizopus microsporus var. microsporus]